MSKFFTHPVPPRMTKVCPFVGCVSTENPKHWNNNDKRTRTIIIISNNLLSTTTPMPLFVIQPPLIEKEDNTGPMNHL